MESQAPNEQWIVRYLLGDLPEEEQARLEDRAFSDRETLHAIEDAENDLIDEYVRGGLSEEERRRFEPLFLASAERRRKVEFARVLARVSADHVPTTEMNTAGISWWEALLASLRGPRFALAAAALLLVFAAVWLFLLNHRIARLREERQARQQQEELLRQQTAEERARAAELAARLDEERARNEELARQLARDQAAAASLATLFLPPGIARGNAERPKLLLPNEARFARLQVGLERGDEFNLYRVRIQTAQGRAVWSRDQLRAQSSRAGRVLQLTLPSSTLGAGQYELTLQGVTAAGQTEDLRYYYFDVLKK